MASDEELLKALESAPEVSDSDLAAVLDSAPEAPPTLLERASEFIKDNTGIKDRAGKHTLIGSLLKGAAEAAPFYATDEIFGAGKAAAESKLLPFGGQDKPSDFGKRYEAERDILREDFKKAHEDNPLTNYLGQAIGGAAGLVALRGIAPAALATRVLSNPAIRGALINRLGATGAKIATGALAAGAEGAVTAAGASEAKDTLGVLKDAGVGLGLGGAVGAVPGAIKAAKDVAKTYTATNKLVRAFDLGGEGINLAKKEVVERLRREFGDGAVELLKAIEKDIVKIQDKKRAMLKGEMTPVAFKDEYATLRKKVADKKAALGIGDADAQEVNKFLDAYEFSVPEQVQKNAASVKTTKLVKEDASGRPITETTTSTAAKDKTLKDMPEVLEQVLATPDKNKRISSSVLEGPGIRKETTTETIDRITAAVERGDMSAEQADNLISQLQQSAYDRKMQNPGVAKAAEDLSILARKKMEAAYPHLPLNELNTKINAGLEAVEALGGKPRYIRSIGETEVNPANLEVLSNIADPTSFIKDKFGQAQRLYGKTAGESASSSAFEALQKRADDFDIARTISGEVAGAGGSSLAKSAVGLSLRQMGLAGANTAGRWTKGLVEKDRKFLGVSPSEVLRGGSRAIRNEAVTKDSDVDQATISSADTDFSDDELNHYAAQLAASDDKHDQNLAGEMSLAQSQESPRTKRAMMWKIMQNPVYRQRLKGLRSAE